MGSKQAFASASPRSQCAAEVNSSTYVWYLAVEHTQLLFHFHICEFIKLLPTPDKSRICDVSYFLPVLLWTQLFKVCDRHANRLFASLDAVYFFVLVFGLVNF